MNKIRAGVKICAVKAPGFGDNRKANLQDIATLTGGTVVSEDVGFKLENVDPAMLGAFDIPGHFLQQGQLLLYFSWGRELSASALVGSGRQHS